MKDKIIIVNIIEAIYILTAVLGFIAIAQCSDGRSKSEARLFSHHTITNSTKTPKAPLFECTAQRMRRHLEAEVSEADITWKSR